MSGGAWAEDGGLPVYTQSTIAMDTIATVSVESVPPAAAVEAAVHRALAWFGVVERTCSRFDPDSELVRLCMRPGRVVPTSALLFQAVEFALQVARLARGAFDPAVGAVQQARGLTHNYLTDTTVMVPANTATYRDVRLDRRRRTITLLRPLLLDLGAIAKGLAIDLAARELAGLERFAVEAGGDLFAGGAATPPRPWRIGVRHPRNEGLLGTLTVWNQAVCSSGDYERRLDNGEHHLVEPRTGRSPRRVISLTAVAPTALAADALGTAAFVLGPAKGLRLLEQQGVAGILVTRANTVRMTPGCAEELAWFPCAERPDSRGGNDERSACLLQS